MNNQWTVQNPGLNITSAVASSGGALPVDSAGGVSRYIRVAATQACYFRLGTGGVPTAVAGDMLIQPGDDAVLATGGRTHAAAVRVTADGICTVTPLENS